MAFKVSCLCCSVSATKIADTEIYGLNSFAVLKDEIGVICGDASKIKSYNLHTGMELNCLNLTDAWGLAEVKFGGKLRLAVNLYSSVEFLICYVWFSL